MGYNRGGNWQSERKSNSGKSWIDAITEDCIVGNIKLFMKDSLIPIVGEENMFRELPWDKDTWEIDRKYEWLDKYYEQETNRYAAIR